MKPFFVYMLRCADGSYHVGHTDDLQGRMSRRDAGEELVWSQETASRYEALVAEQRIKGLAPAKKEALIAQHRDRIPPAATAQRKVNLRRPHPPVETPTAAPRRVNVRRPHPPVADPPVVERPSAHADTDAPLIEAVLHSSRRAIAKSITLLESTRADHRQRADALLNALLPHTGKALRIGISGVPGVGKSTFIEALGLYLIDQGHRVAVLTVDPSSSLSGGSILGDKTRMERLSVHDRAYIRPSPAAGTLGGVAEKTREAMLVCEAAGYDVIVVETVGVGQSEIAVAGMTDLFVLLQLPNAGDDLQAIKKGVMELADLVVVNKADIDPDAATRAHATLTSALRMFSTHGQPGHGTPKVMQASALQGHGIEAFWQHADQFHRERRASGEFDARRKKQALAWMWELIQARLQTDFKHHAAVREALPRTLRDVADARVAPSSAARTLLELFERH